MYKLDNNVEWTEELKNAFKTGTTRAKIIYDENQEINETNMLKSLELKDTQYVPSLGFIGQACSKEFTFSFVNSEGINLENKELTLKIGAEYNGEVYYITYGNFIVCEAPHNDKTNNVTSVVANDYMIKFDVAYEDTITYPCTLKNLAENICTQVGVQLGSTSFRNDDFVVVDNQFEGSTAKEVIKNIAKSAFSWARIGQDNKLYFDLNTNTINQTITEVITTSDYKLNNFKHADEYYGGLNRIGYADSDIEGQEEYVQDTTDIEQNGLKDLFIYDNLFAYTETKRQELVQAATELLGFKYMPIQKLDLKGLIYLDCTDFLEIVDADNNSTSLYSRCFNHTISYQGYTFDTIETLAPSETERTYENLNSPLLANSRTQIIVDKANKKINLAVESIEETDQKVSELEISVDGISGTVNNLVDVTINGETSANNLIMNGVNISQPIKLKIKPIGESITTLYPRNNLYPSNTLYSRNIAIQFKRTYTELDIETGLEVEKTDYTYYELPDSLLYQNSNVYDEFELDYDAKTCKVTKKLTYDANGNIIALSSPQTNYYDYPYIELRNGDYEISIPGYETVYIAATLMKENEYTTKFATQVQVDTQVKQTENEVMISVNQKVSEDEFTKAEIIARINSEGTSEATINADAISLEGYTTINGGFSVDEEGNASIANGSVNINDEGIQLANGRSIVGGNGMLTQFQYNGNGLVGHMQGANTVNQRIALYIPIYIPQNFVITEAKLFITHTYAYVYEYTQSGYQQYTCYARNIKLYHGTQRGIPQLSGGFVDNIAPASGGTEVYNFGSSSGKTFSSNSIENVTVDNISNYLQSGMQYLYLADYTNNPSDWVTASRMSGNIDATLYVTGYLQNNIE